MTWAGGVERQKLGDGVRASVVRKKARVVSSSRTHLVETEEPIYVIRVAVVCPETDEPSKFGYRLPPNGTKVWVARMSSASIPRPTLLRIRRKPRRPSY